MRRIFMVLVLLMLCSNVLYGVEERRELKPQPIPNEVQKAQQGLQQQRPLVLPQPGTMTLPTVSINISAPQIPQEAIRQPQTPVPLAPSTSIMHNIPSMPQYAAPPGGEIPGIPVFGNTGGKVTKIGYDKDGGIRFIEVDDKTFERELNIKIKNLAETPIVKGASLYNFDNIKIGDAVDIMFYTQNDVETAVFIKVLTEEETGEMKQDSSSGLEIAPDKSEDSNELPTLVESNAQSQE